MEGKIAVIFSFVLLGLALIWMWVYSQDVDDLTRSLNDLTRNAESVDRQIELQKEQHEFKIRGAELTAALKLKIEEKELLAEQIVKLESEAPRLEELRVQAISQVRAKSVGLEFPELTMHSGTVLKNARIQRVTEDAATIQHSQGVTVARSEDLPADLRDRLRLGETVVKAAAAPAAEETPAPPKDGPAMAAYKEDLKRHNHKLLEMRLKTEQMANELRALDLQVQAAERAASDATSATQKFYTRTHRDQLKTQQALLQRNLDNARIEIQRQEAKAPVHPALQ